MHSVVWRLLPLMNSFIKTETAIFPMQKMLPEVFPVFSDCYYGLCIMYLGSKINEM